MMKSKIKFTYITIAALVIIIIIIFLQRSCSSLSTIEKPIIVTKYDTVWKKVDTVFIKKLVPYTVIKTLPTKEYIPSNNCDSLKQQYISIRDSYINKVVYKDSTKVTGFAKGNIIITDTLQFNKLLNRKWEFNLEVPEITKTITITEKEKPKRQLYIGANLFGDKKTLQSITPGLLYKDRKDRIFQANVGVNFDGTLMYGVGTYWKINLNKK